MKLLKLFVMAGVFGALVLSGGCSKKTEQEMDMAAKPKHCYNQLLDADETQVDFGGSCGTDSLSASLASECGMTNNTADINNSYGLTTNYRVYSCVKTVSGGIFTYTLTLPGGHLIHVRTTSTVLMNHELTFTTSSPTASDECEIDFYMASVVCACSGTGGHVCIKYNGTTYAISICSVPYYSMYPGTIDAYATVD